MRNKTIKLMLMSASIFIINFCKSSNLDLATKTSVIQVNSGAGFIIDNSISDIVGTIIQDSGAIIEGENIYFSEGTYQEANNKIGISGTLTPGVNGKITLDGNKTFRGKRGSILKGIDVTNKNNRVEGDVIIEKDITFLDSHTTLSVDIITNLKSNIYLNGGDLYVLEDDLQFVDNKRVYGPGKIYINGNKLIFGAKPLILEEDLYFIDAQDVQFNDNITISCCLTFSGCATIEGNLNLIDLYECGKIIVERGSSILIKNTILHNVNSDNLFCMDNSGTITFQNVKMYLNSNYTFSIGKFAIADKVSIFGDSKFTYKSPNESIILSKSNLSLDSGITFSYDPGNMRKDLIQFQDNRSCITLNGATIHATLTGMQLKKGSLHVKQNSFLKSEKTDLIDEGITFGNDTAEEDFICKILKSSKLELLSGSLKYRNISSSGWAMENYMSTIEFNTGCNLYLYQNLNIEPGSLNYKGRGGLFYASGKNLTGFLNVTGYLDYMDL